MGPGKKLLAISYQLVRAGVSVAVEPESLRHIGIFRPPYRTTDSIYEARSPPALKRLAKEHCASGAGLLFSVRPRMLGER
jgi:hypothetical protein